MVFFCLDNNLRNKEKVNKQQQILSAKMNDQCKQDNNNELYMEI